MGGVVVDGRAGQKGGEAESAFRALSCESVGSVSCDEGSLYRG